MSIVTFTNWFSVFRYTQCDGTYVQQKVEKRILQQNKTVIFHHCWSMLK